MNGIKHVILNRVKNLSNSAAVRWLTDASLTLSMTRMVSLCIFMLMLTACEHRPLEDPNTGHYLRIYLDEEIKNVTCGFYDESLKHPEYKRPYVIRVVLADPASGRVVSERYFQHQGEETATNQCKHHHSGQQGSQNHASQPP